MEGLQQGNLNVYQQVLRRCQAILRDQPDAEDATQEVFTRAAAAGRNGFDVDWLLGVATHVCVDEFRRRGRLRRAMTQAGAMADATDPEETAVGEVLAHHLISHLSPLEARLLSHRVETGASLEESANHLGIAASTARNLAMRIRQKLRPLMPLSPSPSFAAWARRLREHLSTTLWAEPMLAPAAVAIAAITVGHAVVGQSTPPPRPPVAVVSAGPPITDPNPGTPAPTTAREAVAITLASMTGTLQTPSEMPLTAPAQTPPQAVQAPPPPMPTQTQTPPPSSGAPQPATRSTSTQVPPPTLPQTPPTQPPPPPNPAPPPLPTPTAPPPPPPPTAPPPPPPPSPPPVPNPCNASSGSCGGNTGGSAIPSGNPCDIRVADCQVALNTGGRPGSLPGIDTLTTLNVLGTQGKGIG